MTCFFRGAAAPLKNITVFFTFLSLRESDEKFGVFDTFSEVAAATAGAPAKKWNVF